MITSSVSGRPSELGDSNASAAVQVMTVGIFQRQPGTAYRTVRNPRVLHDNQFLWVMTGNVVWVCGGETFNVGPDSVLLARAGVPDYFRWDGPGLTSMGYFHFTVDHADIDAWPKVRQLPPDDVIRPLFRHVAWLTEAKPNGWRRQRVQAARLLLDTFVSGAFDTKPRDQAAMSPVVVRAMNYVERTWSDGRMQPISLADLASAASVSVRQVCRAFSESVGCGPIESLRLLRLHRAASLLTHTNHSVSQIAELTGFANPFHFSHRFAEIYGESPRAFRQHTVQSSYFPAPPRPVHRLGGRLWERS